MTRLRFVLCLALLFWGGTLARAGYDRPSHIDGCQSADGRFVITASPVGLGKEVHGPHRWQFTWKDTRTGAIETFPAQGVQGGQIYAQLFIAPDGETFALWNHVTLWTSGKSDMHGPKDLPHHEDSNAWRGREEFTRRLIVYRKDGSIIKELGVADLLEPEEWESVLRVFNRVDWLRPYDGLNHKATARPQYAFYRISPDYTVLEFQPVSPRAKRNDPPRVVRVSLTDGRVLDAGARLEGVPKEKIPVRPFQGDDHLPHSSPGWIESYTPSLDSVRTPGTYKIQSAAEASPLDKAPKLPAFPYGPAKLIRDGYKKADTPAWLPNAGGGKSPGGVVFTDLEQQKLLLYSPPDAVAEVRSDLTRGKVGPDKRFYGIRLLPSPSTDAAKDVVTVMSVLASWQPGTEPQTIVEWAAGDRELSLNDLVVASRGLIYFTTLKDPDKGRLSVVDPRAKTVRVLFDGEDEPTLANPNGIALSPDERFLYVGISNYKNQKHSGVYCFPIRDDGAIDVALGKARPWAAVQSPDGIAVDREGNVYFTAGGVVEVFDRYGRRWGQIKIPKGSGTNLCLGGDQGDLLYITTWNALYAVEVAK